jgi:L-threonylcarbamoyladenylate synthase
MDVLDNLEEILKNGGTILYPTDTIWGVGCDATNEEACQKILNLKQRPEDKSFIVLVDSIQMLEKYTISFPEVCYDLIDYAVRPLTIIYPNSRGLAPSVIAKDGSVGIRVTNDPFCIKLIRTLKRPIVSTSANISGEKSPINFATVSDLIKQGVDIVIPDNGKSNGQPSQIIKIGDNSSVQIIRE